MKGHKAQGWVSISGHKAQGWALMEGHRAPPLRSRLFGRLAGWLALAAFVQVRPAEGLA